MDLLGKRKKEDRSDDVNDDEEDYGDGDGNIEGEDPTAGDVNEEPTGSGPQGISTEDEQVNLTGRDLTVIMLIMKLEDNIEQKEEKTNYT